MHLRSHRCAALIALLLMLGWASPALACTPPPGGLPTYTIAQRVAAADVVLEGTVTSLATTNIPNDTATIAVQGYYKGAGTSSVTIDGFGPGSLCRSEVHVGDHLIFFAKHTSTGLAASYLGQFDATAPATQDVIDQVLVAVSMIPRMYLPLVASGDAANSSRVALPRADWSALLACPLAFALALGFAWRRSTGGLRYSLVETRF